VKTKRQGQQERHAQRWAAWDEFSPEDHSYRIRSLQFKMLDMNFFVDPGFGLAGAMKHGLAAFVKGP
jgi:hypothetical protein